MKDAILEATTTELRQSLTDEKQQIVCLIYADKEKCYYKALLVDDGEVQLAALKLGWSVEHLLWWEKHRDENHQASQNASALRKFYQKKQCQDDERRQKLLAYLNENINRLSEVCEKKEET